MATLYRRGHVWWAMIGWLRRQLEGLGRGWGVIDPFIFRLAAWSIVAALAVLLFVCLGIGFEERIIESWFEGKLAFLGLIIAGGTFQYGIFVEIAQRAYERVRDPAWHDVRDTEIANIADAALPHNRVVLANYVVIGAFLLVSVIFDFLIILRTAEPPAWRCISTALFAVAVLPFLEIWYRYARSLAHEFASYLAGFRALR